MSTIIDGAEVSILVDTARIPFILDVHLLDDPSSLLNPESAAVGEVACDVLHASWTWGAAEWRGPLTMAEAGSVKLVFHDPDRVFDTANPAGTPPVPGSRVQVLVDGLPAFTGYVAQVTHSLASHESTLLGHDAVAMLAQQAFLGFVFSGTTFDNFNAVLSAVGFPHNRRVTYGSPAGFRTAGEEPAQAWPALMRIARAELGTVWADRADRVAFRGRGIDEPDIGVLPIIGCEGADLEDVVSLEDRAAIVDHVVVEPDDTQPQAEWADTEAIGLYGKRTLRAQRDELRLALAP